MVRANGRFASFGYSCHAVERQSRAIRIQESMKQEMDGTLSRAHILLPMPFLPIELPRRDY